MLERILERINGKTLSAIAIILIAQAYPDDKHILYGLAIIIASLSNGKCKQQEDKQ
jgi:hypothetical protein